ncbi:hypothetical protein HMPREF9554_00944 [Treponema phagedenis F0421]|nr:hypothetical protein HMPREF9554_00944 [Treponema phagedenis F0421]
MAALLRQPLFLNYQYKQPRIHKIYKNFYRRFTAKDLRLA